MTKIIRSLGTSWEVLQLGVQGILLQAELTLLGKANLSKAAEIATPRVSNTGCSCI